MRQRLFEDRSMRALPLAGFAALLTACEASGSGSPMPEPPAPPQRYSLEQLKDPKTCEGCHPQHYREWASSMHAYASFDPVFLAMNRRGQRETNGALGEFCVQCHAPMALRDQLTTDGLNLDQVPDSAQGVTCYFCHNAIGAGSDHFNANVLLANDDTMRGSIRNAVDPGAHGVAYSAAHDRNKMDSSTLCGACHDVVNPKGTHIERTLEEYKGSIFSLATNSVATGGDSCQGCHMPWQETGPVARVSGMDLPDRDRHEHRWPAVDVALTDFPDRDAHEHATRCELGDIGAPFVTMTALGLGQFEVQIEGQSGHKQPSGTAQDRRLWVEFTAYDKDDNVLLESGKIGPRDFEEYPADDPRHDPNLCLFRDYFADEADHEVHMFWEAAKLIDTRSKLLPFTVDRNNLHIATCRYQLPGRQQPARVEVRMHMRPVGMDVLQDLVDSGDLDPAVLDAMPTFALQRTAIEWRADDDDWTALPVDISCP